MVKKFLLIGIILSVVIIASAFYLFKDSTTPQTHIVNLTEEGFSPAKLSINKGDTVVFTTNRNKQFWPASNLHPTHGIYPEFDPRQPIEPNSSWSFKFDKIGEWKYHDHLAPLYRGAIKVLDKKPRAFSQTVMLALSSISNGFWSPPRHSAGRPQNDDGTSSCENVKGSEKLKCFEDMMDLALKDKGVSEAFEILANLYKTEATFASACHDFAHKLGKRAYELFSSHKEFSLSSKSSYCGYGFYHGFMETLLQTSADMNEARKFCEYADKKLMLTTSDAGGACYHGIGHGAVDGADSRNWGDPYKMIKPGLKLCEMVSSDENPPPRYGKLFRCVTGVFNGLEILASSNRYKLSLNKDDPFWICKKQPDRYKEACFTQFVVAVMNVTGNDFVKSSEIIDTIEEDDYAIPTLQSLVVELVHQNKTDYQKTLDFCRNLSSRFQIPCVSAYAEGFMKYGPPQKEYVEALNFCSSPSLTHKEKSACFDRALSILRIWYTAEKSKEICQSVDEKYQWNECQYN